MEFEERVVRREEFDDEFLGLLSFVFSDDNLASAFVIKQLLTWKSNQDYSLVFIVKKDLNLSSFVTKIRLLIPKELFTKIGEQCFEKGLSGGAVPDKIVCYNCKNYGSVVSGRTLSSSIRFVCEICLLQKQIGVQPISDLIWNRRCNEGSFSQMNTYSQLIKSIRRDVEKLIGNTFYVMPSMMILKIDMDTSVTTLSTLFSVKAFRREGHGERLIKFIPLIKQGFSISICTAGLETKYLFSELIYF